MSNKAAMDDSDLEDLLSHGKGGDNMERAPLNLDHLTKGQLDVPSRSSGPSFNIVAYCSAWMSYMCYAHPKLCTCFAMGAVGIAMFVLVNVICNPTETFGVIANDYSNIQSEYDLTLGKIDHWCLKGDNDSCRCEDPLEPTSRGEFKTWVQAHHENKKHVEGYLESDFLDVAFLGESLVEEMDGRWLGRTVGDELKAIAKNFRRHFKKEESGMEGVALGIAGDTSPNVLYRLLHGEMPPDFNPRVWWVALGMNDLGRMQCSEEVVILGILRVVEEILTRKPDAEVVINSMLPMADLRGGVYPQMADYKDAFRQYKGRPVTNPQLIAMKNPGAAGPNGARYTRPSSTTEAIRNRAEKKWRDGIQGGPGYKGPPPPKGTKGPPPTKVMKGPPPQNKPSPKDAPPSKPEEKKEEKKGASRRRILKESSQEKKEQKKKEKAEEAQEGDISKQKKGGSGGDDKKEKKMIEQYLKKVKKDPVNPKMDLNKSRIKARDAAKVFVKPTKLPLWTSIHAINEELRKFAEKHERVHFFDATNIFAEREQGSKWMLMSDKISIRGHPTELGFELWQDAMALKLKQILEKDDAALAKELEEERNAKIKKEKADEKSPEEDATPADGEGDDERF